MTAFEPLPREAAWRHHPLREGFEAVQVERRHGGHRFTGCTTAVEAGRCWAVQYEIDLAQDWTTRRAEITERSTGRAARTVIAADGQGRWWIDGDPAEHLGGCLDIDLESSALTNTMPVHRLTFTARQVASCPAAYVRAPGLAVQRLEQTYRRFPDADNGPSFDYTAPLFDFTAVLSYDRAGLVLEYPGIATRNA